MANTEPKALEFENKSEVQENLKTSDNDNKFLQKLKNRVNLNPILQKVLLFVFGITAIVIIWVLCITVIGIETKILLNFEESFSGHSNNTLELNNLIQELSNNQTDNYTFSCPDNYVHSSSFPYCSPSCTIGDYCATQSCFDFHRAIISIIDIVAILLSIFVLISWPFIKSFWEFPQVSIFFVVICLSLLTFTFSIGDIPGPSYYCDANSRYSFDDVKVLFQERLIGQGVLLHFLRYSILFWITFSLLNIVIAIEYSYRHKMKSKLKIIIVSVEALIAFGIPAIFCIVTLALSSNYIYESFGSFAGFQTVSLFIIGRVLPDFLTVISSMTLVIFIIVRFRWLWINSMATVGQGRNMSSLEKRFIIYCLLYCVLFVFFVVESVWFFTVSTEEFVTIFDYRACITLQSPIIVYKNLQAIRYNATYELIPASVWQNGTDCDGLGPHIDSLGEILITYNILYRLERLIFFLVFVLKANILVWFNWFKSLTNHIRASFGKVKVKYSKTSTKHTET
ncbi:hypothetical protein LOD99_6727 [Oopsacas minuta]|uniref:Uncharacterized protein n=1 Tax=Oopsacas minuta TaxID=111878 RepID=A0AAV7JKY4_9METZ|nr:hypothetical protein LOD99_6727 [Oopsacas minuta]